MCRKRLVLGFYWSELCTHVCPSLLLTISPLAYNDKLAKEASDKGPIDFANYEDQLLDFKKQWIWKSMIEEEIRDNVMATWLQSVDLHSFEFSWYLSRDGRIDESRRPEKPQHF